MQIIDTEAGRVLEHDGHQTALPALPYDTTVHGYATPAGVWVGVQEPGAPRPAYPGSGGKLIASLPLPADPAAQSAAETNATLAAIATRRLQEEESGTIFNGAPLATDRHSQMKVIGAALAAELNPEKVRNWKAPGGFVQIDAQMAVAVAQAVDDHVQACFDRESELVAAVEGGTYSPEMLDEGWP